MYWQSEFFLAFLSSLFDFDKFLGNYMATVEIPIMAMGF